MARAGRIRDLERRWEGGMEAGGARAGESVRANEGRWRQRRGVPTPLAPTPDALSRVLRPRPTFSQPNSQNRLLQEVPRLLPEVMTFITHRQRDVRTDREKKKISFLLSLCLAVKLFLSAASLSRFPSFLPTYLLCANTVFSSYEIKTEDSILEVKCQQITKTKVNQHEM